MRLLIDTDVLISWSKKKDQGLLDNLIEENQELYLSTISLAEFRAGVYPQDLPFYNLVKKIFPLIDVDLEIAELAGKFSFDLARTGLTINLTDHLIAATAQENSLTLVTFNTKHFPHPDLKLYF